VLASWTIGDQLGLWVVLAVGVFVGLLEVGEMTWRSPVAAKKYAVRTMVAHGDRSLLVKLLDMNM